MQITKITNNYLHENKRQALGFGRLMVKDNVPFEIAEAALKSKGVRKLTQLFHNIGLDITVVRAQNPESLGYSCITQDEVYESQTLLMLGEKVLKRFGDLDVRKNAFGTVVDIKSEFDGPRKLKKFSARAAKSFFNDYNKKQNARVAYIMRLNNFEPELAAFNASLSEPDIKKTPVKTFFQSIFESVFKKNKD